MKYREAPRNTTNAICLKRTGTLHTSYFFVLNYDAMKRLKLCTYSGLVVLVALLFGCSSPEENAGSSNTNTAPQANSNTAAQGQIAKSNAPNALSAPTAIQPSPILPSIGSSPAANSNAAIAPPAPVVNPSAPKLVVSAKRIEFGQQPQDKTMVRAIIVKNGGREDLKIESVVPS